MKLLAILITLIFSSQASAQHMQQNQELKENLVELYEALHIATENNACRKDIECQAYGIGDRPCGGPASYIVLSTRTTDMDEFTKLVNSYNEVYRQAHEGMVSTCEYRMPPVVKCIRNKCLRPSKLK